MFKGIIGLLVGASALAGAALAQQPQPEMQLIRAAVLRVDEERLPPISRLDLPVGDQGFAGARLAIEDNDTTGRFIDRKSVV